MVFTTAWCGVYVVCGVAGNGCPVDLVMIIILHTTVVCVLYSASYTSSSGKAVKARARLGLG